MILKSWSYITPLDHQHSKANKQLVGCHSDLLGLTSREGDDATQNQMQTVIRTWKGEIAAHGSFKMDWLDVGQFEEYVM